MTASHTLSQLSYSPTTKMSLAHESAFIKLKRGGTANPGTIDLAEVDLRGDLKGGLHLAWRSGVSSHEGAEHEETDRARQDQ